MKIEGTLVSYPIVDIDPTTVLRQLKKDWVYSIQRELDIPDYFHIHSLHINQDNKWEAWDDCRGQGSGDTEVLRDATPYEITIYNGFSSIIDWMTTRSIRQ
jgi:hypothetical protein